MTDPNDTLPPRSKTQKILDDLNRGEGVLARAAGAAAARLAMHPHLAFAAFVGWTVFSVWAGFKIGQP